MRSKHMERQMRGSAGGARVSVVEPGVDPDTFTTTFELGEGKPALLRGLVETNFPVADLYPEEMVERFGAGTPMQIGEDEAGATVEMRLDAFVGDYLSSTLDRNPFLVFDGIILHTLSAEKLEYEIPRVFARDDFLSVLGEMERPPHKWLLIAPKCSGSPVHVDPMGTSAWNALISGRKRWFIAHPSVPVELLRPGAHRVECSGTEVSDDSVCNGGAVAAGAAAAAAAAATAAATGSAATAADQDEDEDDEEKEDGEEGGGGNCEDTGDADIHRGEQDDWEDVYGYFFDDLEEIKKDIDSHFAGRERMYLDFVQNAGEIVFVPAQWHHAVLNLEASVAITHNFCSRANLGLCFRLGAAGDMPPKLAKRWRDKMMERFPTLAEAEMPESLLPKECHVECVERTL